MVVNFDLPVDVNGRPDCETNLHRIGRTGRFGKPGVAINMVHSEYSMTILQTIDKHFGKRLAYYIVFLKFIFYILTVNRSPNLETRC